jgi:hypothetical protein
MKRLIGPAVFALIGLVCIGFGVHMLNRDWVECEVGTQIQPGETCTNAQRPGRAPAILTYEEQRASQKRIGAVAIGFGALILVSVGWSVWKERRRSPSA